MQDKTAILAATTPQDNSTYHSFLISRRDPDRPEQLLFNVVNLIEICKACKKSEKPWKCEHKSYNTSSNKSTAKRRETELLYPPNKKHIAMRELFGQAAGGSGGLIPDDDIQVLHSNICSIELPPRAIYLGIDPGGGGPGELGIVAMVETMTPEGPRTVVRIIFFLIQMIVITTSRFPPYQPLPPRRLRLTADRMLQLRARRELLPSVDSATRPSVCRHSLV